MKREREGENSNNYWMEVGDIANKCLDGNQLTEDYENAYDLANGFPTPTLPQACPLLRPKDGAAE